MTATLKINLGEALEPEDFRRLVQASVTEGKSIDTIVLDAVRAALNPPPEPGDARRELAVVA